MATRAPSAANARTHAEPIPPAPPVTSTPFPASPVSTAPDVIVPAVRVHVISDMEGVAGIVKWQQVAGGEKLYEEGRVLYTEEINAAVRGAKAAGATEIVVMDNHGAGGEYSFNSLLPELLDPACEYVQPGATAFTRPRGAMRTISFLRLRSSPPWSADFAAA